MHLKKKFLITGVLCVVVLAGVLGGFAIASADDGDSARDTLMDKVAEIYQKNTGTAIDAQELQKAFTEAGGAVRLNMRDQMLQKLVDEGKITQEQADAWKSWLESRPDKALTDEFKTWMESRPEIPSGIMPFGDRQSGMRGLGNKLKARICFPDLND